MARLELRNLTMSYGRRTAIENVTVAAGDGELLVLFGPTGCGKTTTLRLIAGLEQPSGGSIHIGGRDVTQMQPHQRQVAMVFQQHSLYPHMTAAQNIRFAMKSRSGSRGIDGNATSFDELVQLTGATDLLDRRPAALSGGEQQRVALAKALAASPAVLLLDEPLSHLDAPARIGLRTMICQVQQRSGTTAVYVTHDQDEALAVADRIAVMHRGKLLQIGSPRDVYERPSNRIVASLLGLPPMNLVPVNVLADSERIALIETGSDNSTPLLTIAHSAIGSALDTFISREVIAGFRPHDLRVTTHESATAPSIRVNLTVERRTFLGSRVELKTRSPSGSDVLATLPDNNDITLNQLYFDLHPDDLYLFATSGDGERLYPA